MKNSSTRPRDDGRAARRIVAHHVSRSAEWLADEVAIDFPSLDEAVERMRDAFLAPLDERDDRPELSAELRLSAHEAFDGVTVPLDVPIRKLCTACGGRGERRRLGGGLGTVSPAPVDCGWLQPGVDGGCGRGVLLGYP